MKIAGFVICFCIGIAISTLNYLLTDRVIKTKKNLFPLMSSVRQIVQVGFIVAIYFIADYTPFDKWFSLFGGVFGVTFSMFFFTYKLVKSTKSDTDKKEDANG